MNNIEDTIRKYIDSVAKNRNVNLWALADELFGKDVLPSELPTFMVIPGLADIPTTKRDLIEAIIYLKTKYRVAPVKDAFMENTILLGGKKGE